MQTKLDKTTMKPLFSTKEFVPTSSGEEKTKSFMNRAQHLAHSFFINTPIQQRQKIRT
jgi:hypothetical protein